MDKKIKLQLRWLFTFIGLFILMLVMFTEAHEAAHAETCKMFGGRVVAQGFDSSKMTVTTICQITQTPEYLIAQSNIEAFGYQLEAFMFGAWMMLFCFGYLMIWMSDTKERRLEGKRIFGDD